LLRFTAVTVAVLFAVAPAAAEPPAAEMLPPPRPAGPPPGMAPPPFPVELMLFPRHDRYEVWQNYGLDRTGHWRPRVIYSAEGAYYRYNGAPFPWAATHPEEFVPRSIQPANFAR
jgi:hypothetical protein